MSVNELTDYKNLIDTFSDEDLVRVLQNENLIEITELSKTLEPYIKNAQKSSTGVVAPEDSYEKQLSNVLPNLRVFLEKLFEVLDFIQTQNATQDYRDEESIQIRTSIVTLDDSGGTVTVYNSIDGIIKGYSRQDDEESSPESKL